MIVAEFLHLSLERDPIDRLRSELADYPAALEALDEIEACEGDVEDAAINLAIRAGQDLNSGEDWLASLAKRCRAQLCSDPQLRQALETGTISTAVRHLQETPPCPTVLILPVVLFACHQGADFCRPLDPPA